MGGEIDELVRIDWEDRSYYIDVAGRTWRIPFRGFTRDQEPELLKKVVAKIEEFRLRYH